jgi:perosamine synthetase
VIPVFEPWVGEEEAAAVAAAVGRGEISGSFGEEIPAFEREFASYVGAAHGVACTSGTTALQLAVAAARIGPGEEVLVPESTNIATALAPHHQGATPVPVDSEPGTGNMDLDLVEEAVGERTRAIMPVHLFGHPVDLDRVMGLAERHDLLVIEDCAQSHGATVRGRMTGSFGHLACFSFYANKIVTTGEGGMVVTDDPDLAERLRYLRNLAFGEPRFVHAEAGFNFRMTGYQAAMGRVQLRRIDAILRHKRRVAETYDRLLADVPGVRGPVERDWAVNVHWMYWIAVGDEYPLSRDELIGRLRERGVESRTHFCPMSHQPALRACDSFDPRPCPVAERLWRCGLYLPSSPTLTEAQIAEVAAHVRDAA